VIVVHPRSKEPRVNKLGDVWHVYVSEPAIEGKANQSVIECLSEQLKVSSSNIKIVKGLKSKNKVIRIQ
jgi:uncharacterized protein